MHDTVMCMTDSYPRRDSVAISRGSQIIKNIVRVQQKWRVLTVVVLRSMYIRNPGRTKRYLTQ